MKITVIEIDYHAEVLRDLCLLLEEMGVEVELFVKEKILRQTGLNVGEHPCIHVHLINSRREVLEVFQKNRPLINRTHLVIFNTLASFYKLFSNLEITPPILLRIHNANTYLNPKVPLRLGRSLDEVWYSIEHIFWKSIIQLDWYYRRKFLRKVDRFVFPSDSMIQFVLNQKLVQESKLLSTPIPLTFSKSEFHREKSLDKLVITIPGTVERKRRDYDSVLNGLRQLTKNERSRIELVLLGKLKGRYAAELVRKLNELTGGLIITCYEQFVSQEIYEGVMSRTDVLLLPIRTETRYQIYQETYGLTKISGGEGEMIKYSLPGIIPEEYKISQYLGPYSLSYSNADSLKEILSGLLSDKSTHLPINPQASDFQTTAKGIKEVLMSVIS